MTDPLDEAARECDRIAVEKISWRDPKGREILASLGETAEQALVRLKAERAAIECQCCGEGLAPGGDCPACISQGCTACSRCGGSRDGDISRRACECPAAEPSP